MLKVTLTVTLLTVRLDEDKNDNIWIGDDVYDPLVVAAEIGHREQERRSQHEAFPDVDPREMDGVTTEDARE